MSASTKDPHVAMIDAHEKMDQIRMLVRTARDALTDKMARGYVMTADDRQELRIFRQRIIDETRRIQDELAEEINSHGKLDS
jgi:phage portal protein BeeE